MSTALSILNEDFRVLEGPQLLHHLIQWQRDGCALDFLGVGGERQRYTYRDLRKCVVSTGQDIVESLKASSHRQRHIVPVLLPQCPALYISILALLESGMAFCPIDLAAPPDRIKFVIEDVSAQIVITTKHHEELVTWSGGPRVFLVDESPAIIVEDFNADPRIHRKPSPQDLAYVMYTSGSSGTPKGVAMSHLAVTQSLLAHEACIPRFNRFLQFAAPSFDVSIFEIFFPLIRGSTLVGCNRTQMLNDLPDVINKLEVDAAELTPTVASSLVQQRSNVPTLKILMTIGEMLTKPVLDSFGQSEKQNGILYAMYGPTEAAIHCTINPQTRVTDKVANIGVPFANVSAFVAATIEPSINDVEVRLLPLGEVGELVLGGSQLAKEYINREEQTKAAFVFTRGQRAYRTGDKARMTNTGTIEILGRITSGQVKIRGQRVELGEIEGAIYRHPGIKSVVASVIDGLLVAFVLSSLQDVIAEGVMKSCASWLPAFMVPNEVVILESFPYLASGKVDKKELEARFEDQRNSERGVDETWRTSTERIIGDAIRSLIHMEVSYVARLSALGIDSLVAIRLATLLRSAGLNPSPVDILKADNIRSLAHTCDQVITRPKLQITLGSRPPSKIQIELEDLPPYLNNNKIDYVMACTPLQDAMLSETIISEIAYRNKILLELPKTSDINQSQRAFQDLAEKNAVLRTTFFELPSQKSAYIQVVWKSLPPSQVEIVSEFSQNNDNPQNFSLHHPLHIQIRLHQGRVQMVLHIHHALYDAWSLELLLDDLNIILSGGCLQQRPSFISVVETHCEEWDSERAWLSKDYWKDHLAQLDLLSMPNFHSITNVNPGLAVTIFPSSIATRDLEAAARGLSVSPQTLFQACYSLILSAYLGCEDICFGTVFSGRTIQIPGIEDVVGPCLATLPIRIDLETVSNMSDVIEQIHITNRKHLEHCFLPLREIKKSCGIEPGRRIFDSLLVWQQTLHDYEHEREFVNLKDSVDYLEFNLTLEITPSSGNIMIKANYQTALFPSYQVDLLLRQVEELVLRLLDSPNISVEAARSGFSQDMSSMENTNYMVAPEVKSLSEPVEAVAINQPDAVAIEFAHAISSNNPVIERLTYSELNSRANQIAHYLVMRAVRPDDLVCICMEKSVELYVSILAISKTRAGYLPVTPDTPTERLHQILHDANVKVILSHSSMGEYLSDVKSHSIVFVDKINFTSLSPENLLVSSSLDNLAYCVFTSGSTGTPKGVLITQRNLLSNLRILAQLYPRFSNSKFLQACSQAFDVSVFEIYFSWYMGGCLCSAVKDVLFRDIELAIQALEVTHLSLTPTVAALIDPLKVPTVKLLVTAGEAVTEKVFNAWANKGLFQGYGPSETTNICTIRPNVTKHHSINNIGPPLGNTSVFVLLPGDKFMLAPRGGEGEFCFGGEQVGRGYLNLSQTVGKFIEHPKFGRLYRSGDYGRLLPDGSLLFTRRKDDQVKVRGHRVELGEINTAMLRYPEVVNCATVVIEGKSQNSQRLVNFWVPKKTTGSEFFVLAPSSSIIGDLFASLIVALPTYMMPSALIPVSSLPSTAQGKIDKQFLVNHYKSLSAVYLDQTSYHLELSYSHTWTEQEAGIAKIVADFVKVPLNDIGPGTSFFNLGVDSITAISLSRAIRQKAGFPVEISDVLRFPTVSRLMSRISQLEQQLDTSASQLSFKFEFDSEFLSAITTGFELEGKIVEQIMPCTPLQEAMLSASEVSEGFYHQKLTFALSSAVSVRDFVNVWEMMVARHEILRICFVQTSHPRFAFAQVIIKEFKKEWRINDQNKGNPSMNGLDENICKRNGTSYEPPYSLSFQENRLSSVQLSMHHALYDGFAISILFEEIEKALRNDLLPSPVSFAPFLHYMCSINLEEADAYWDQLLSGFCPFEVPKTARPSETTNVEQGGRGWQIIFPKAKLSWIEEQIKNLGCTLLSVCQTVWASLLADHANAADICFGSVVSGRNVSVEGIDRLVAPCFNTIPVRLKDMHNLSFIESFRIMQAQNIASLPFQLTPLRRILSRSGYDGQRLFDTLLILQQPERDLDESLWTLTHDDGTMDLPLVLEITPRPANTRDSLEIKLHHHPAYLSSKDADELLKQFTVVFSRALENPRHKVLSPSFRNMLKNQEKLRHISKQSVGDDTIKENSGMTAMELEIRDILAVFTDLPKDRIKRNTSIYRLGLDSISALQLAAKLRNYGHNVLGSDLIRNPSIAQLVSHLNTAPEIRKLKPNYFDFKTFDQNHREYVCSKYHIQSENIAAIRPCTPVQCGMLSQTLRSDGEEYINSICMKLAPATSITKLQSAWDFVMNKYEILRTGFIAIEDSKTPFVMVTFPANHTSLPWKYYTGHELNCLSAENHLATISDTYITPPWTLGLFKDDVSTSLKFTGHHAIYDAHSLELILSDVASSYNSEILPSPTTQKSINPLLEAILIASEDNASAKKLFWEKENKISVNRFPDLCPLRQSSMRFLSREVISKISVAELERCCKERVVVTQAVGQVVWGKILSAYVGEPYVTFGIVLSGRSVSDGSENVAFPTIVTLPVNCHVIGKNSDLLDRTMRSNAQLLEHQFTPLASIQRWAGYPEGKTFDSIFTYQKTSVPSAHVDYPWKIVQEESSADYIVSMEMEPIRTGELKLRITFKEHLVPVEQADIILEQFDALLLDTLRSPNNPSDSSRLINLGTLSISPSMKPELPSPVKVLHNHVERQAQLKPSKIAFEFTFSLGLDQVTRSSWTYEQLNQEGNKIASLLSRYHVTRGDLIAICFEKCPEASFAILGILKAGCAYVALDPNAPPDRLKFIIQDSRSKFILAAGIPAKTLSRIYDRVRADQAPRVIDLDSEKLTSGLSSDMPFLQPPISPQDTCYCLYTSGTTGTPKGCEITHENAVQAIMSFQKLFEGHWTDDSKWLQFASFHFDVSVLEQFWSWSVGICVASAPRDLIFEDIPGAIRQMGVTHIDLTPSLARLLHPNDVPSLTKGVFITGGEQLRQDILDVWGDYECIYNGYGPTEATIGVTMYPRVPKNGKPSNIGWQFPNVGTYVFKVGTTEPVLRGAVGELCVSGKLVGKGYLNRPDLTRERFPYVKEFSERLYRTGDLVRLLHDGSFLFLGRADDQVKLRGQRLELNEINEVIKKYVPNIQDAATLVLKHKEQQREQLVAFFVHGYSDTNPMSTPELITKMRDACNAHLSAYMVPTYFIELDKIPLSGNNKADFKKLAGYFDSLSLSDLQKLSPTKKHAINWTDREQEVVRTLARVLKVESSVITSSMNIFELGIDSISVIGLARRLQSAGYANAKISTVMKNSSIGNLVKILAARESTGDTTINSVLAASQRIAAFAHMNKLSVAEELKVDPSRIEHLAPCTPAQEGMVYRFLGSEEMLYFTTFNFVLHKSVETGFLRDAWMRVARRLQILRTKFVLTNHGAAQAVLKDSILPWTEEDLPNELQDVELHGQRQNNEILKIGKTAALANPYRVSILRYQEQVVMSINIFHGLYDGLSLPLMLREVYKEYVSRHDTAPRDLDYEPTFHSALPYGPLALTEGAQDFWTEALRDAVNTSMPRLAGSRASSDVSMSRTISDVKYVEDLRQRLGVTTQALVQAAWCSVLQDYVSSNITIGLVLSGRSIDFLNIENVIGPLLNTVPFHIRITDKMTWKDLVHTCHDFNMRLVPYQHTALKDIQKWCRHGTSQPLFDTLFVYQQEGDDDSEKEHLWKALPLEQLADYPLAFEAQLNNNGDIAITVIGQKDVLDETMARSLLERVEVALRALQYIDQKLPHSTVTSEEGIEVDIDDKKREQGSRQASNLDKRASFKWTSDAQILKTEIEHLSGMNDINEEMSIFELGLDSIDVIKLVSRLRNRGIRISVSAVINSQTIVKMLDHISTKNPSPSSKRILIAEYERRLVGHLKKANKFPEDAITALPATPLQEGMVAEMISSEYTRYFNHELFRVPHHVNMGKLKDAWSTVIQRNGILRTRFVEIDDVDLPTSFAQVIYKPSGSYWTSMRLSNSASLGSEVENAVQKAREGAQSGLLLYLKDIQHGEDQYFILSIAHALYDGWSLQCLHEEIWKVYNEIPSNRPDPRPILELVLNTDGPKATNFWKTSLSTLQKSKFLEKQSSSKKSPETVHRRERASCNPLRGIQETCKALRISLQTLGQTIWAMLLATHLKRLDVVFGAVLACRDSNEASQLMFPLMNTVAIRSVIHGKIRDMLQYMQETGNAIREHQHFPLRKAQALAGVDDSSLFDSLFIYQGQARDTISEDDRLYESVNSVSDVEFAVCVEMEVVQDNLVWRVACKESALSAEKTDKLLASLDDILGSVIQNPDRPTISHNQDGVSICGLPRFNDQTTKASIGDEKTVARASPSSWTARDIIIRRILSQVSKIPEEQIEKDQTIFHLGLDSISAIKVSSLLRREGIRLSVGQLLKNVVGNIGEVATSDDVEPDEKQQDIGQIITDAMRNVDREEILRKAGVDLENVEDILPVGAGQLYMLSRWHSSGGSLFVGEFKYKLDNSTDRQKLGTAWHALQRKHQILRTLFVIANDRQPDGKEFNYAVQIILKQLNNKIKWMDQLDRECVISLSSPVSLSVQRSKENLLLSLRIHHALYDGVSLPLILKDLQMFYATSQYDISPDRRFREFLALSHGRDINITRQHQFWKSYLDLGASTLLHLGGEKGDILRGSRVEIFEPDVPIVDVVSLAQKRGVSVDAVLLAAFSRVYRRLLVDDEDFQAAGKALPLENVVFGLYLANRAVFGEDLSSLAAPTLNLLPIRVAAAESLMDVASRVQGDLQKLGSADVASSSLKDIAAWTHVKVNCFVNILKPAEADITMEGSSSLLFQSSGEELRSRRADVIEAKSMHIEAEQDNGLRNGAYLPSVDIEMRVTNGGTGLDIGVFAPAEYLDLRTAGRVVEEIKEVLTSAMWDPIKEEM